MALDLVSIEHGPNPEVLTHPAAVVTFPLSAEDKKLIDEMKEMVVRIDGVGLAAPQVGVSKQIIVYYISEDAVTLRENTNEVIPPTALINPQYKPAPDAKIVYDWEGCFSVVDTTGKVPRYDKISYTAYTPEGKPINAIAQGFTARVLQHEIDHIQGILIIHRLTKDCVQGNPTDMMLVRIREMTPEQRAVLRKKLMAKEQTAHINPETLERIRDTLDDIDG